MTSPEPSWAVLIGPDAVTIPVTGASEEASLEGQLAALQAGTEVVVVSIGRRGRRCARRVMRNEALVNRASYIPLPSARQPTFIASCDRTGLRYLTRNLLTVPPGTSRSALTTAGLFMLRLPGAHHLLQTIRPDLVLTGRRP